MTVLEIVQGWLRRRAQSFDGLVNLDGECACETEDLAPCGEILDSCEAGHKKTYPNTCQGEDACPVEGKCDWHMFVGPRR